MNKTLKTLGIAALAALLGACSSGSKEDPTLYFVTMGTFESQTDTGSTFSIQEGADTPEVLITSKRKVNVNVFPVGCRLLLAYTNEANQAFAPGPVDLVDIGQVINGKLEMVEGNTHGTYAFQVLAMWRTGRWLNVSVNLPYNKKYEKFRLEISKDELDKAVPEIFLVYEPDTESEAQYYGYYASFDISEIWDNPDVTAFKVRYFGTGIGDTTFTKP